MNVMIAVFVSTVALLHTVTAYNDYYHTGNRGIYNAREIHGNKDAISKLNKEFQTKVREDKNTISKLQSKLKGNVSHLENVTAELQGNLVENYQNLTLHIFRFKNEVNKDITILKKNDNVKNLETKVQEIQLKLETKVQEMQQQLGKLETRMKVDYSHCQSLSASTCGPCLCFDDYKLSSKYYCDCQNLQPKRDCLEFYTSGVKINGVYKVTMNNLKIMQVYCDQTTDGGGWTVFQRRYDGSTDFYRHWEDYKEGFGTLQHEFYLGNENMHVLTAQSLIPKGTELRIDMKTLATNEAYFAKYRHFQINNQFLNYMILVYGYQGTAGDSLTKQSGSFFSTYDRDNDANGGKTHCARIHHGAWWYSSCGESNLNGLLNKSFEGNNTRKIYWNALGNKKTLSFVEMKARRAV